MNATKSFALLRDFSQLITKHGPSTLADLADLLKTPERVAELVTLLEAAEAVANKANIRNPQRGKSRKKVVAVSLSQVLSGIKQDDPVKVTAISDFYEGLVSKRVLPTLAELRRFARDNELRPIKATSRDKALYPFMRDVTALSTQDVLRMMNHLSRDESAPGDRSLERWAGVILDRNS